MPIYICLRGFQVHFQEVRVLRSNIQIHNFPLMFLSIYMGENQSTYSGITNIQTIHNKVDQHFHPYKQNDSTWTEKIKTYLRLQ